MAVLLAGSVAYSLSQNVSVWHGFLFSLDTVATVGSAPEPNDLPGQLTKVLLIVLGVGTLFYALVTVTEFFVAGHLGEILEERRTLKKIEDLNGHHLICGFGRVGRQVARDLQTGGDRLRDHRQPRREPAHRRADGRALPAGPPLRGRDAEGGRHRARDLRPGLRRLRRREHLHLPDRTRASIRHHDRRASERRGLGEEAAPRGRRPGDLPLQVERRGDGPAGAPAAGHRGRRRRPRVPDGGDRRQRGLPGRGDDDRSGARDHLDRGAPQHRRQGPSPAVLGHGAARRRRAGGDGNRGGPAQAGGDVRPGERRGRPGRCSGTWGRRLRHQIAATSASRPRRPRPAAARSPRSTRVRSGAPAGSGAGGRASRAPSRAASRRRGSR